MNDFIDRQVAIEQVDNVIWDDAIANDVKKLLKELPPAKAEPLTYNEQIIFLSAMLREEKVCKQVDEESTNHGVNLVKICREIRRKVVGALWTKN